MIFPIFISFALLNLSFGFILVDYDCSKFTTNYVYNESAASCSNSLTDERCEELYPKGENVAKYPTTGRNDARPSKCFSEDNGSTISPTIKYEAVTYCPKTCGFCCIREEYNCLNADKPAIKCETLTDAMCKSPVWREVIAENCPGTCGLCNEQGCFDAIADCKNPVICNDSRMSDYANRFCRKTCNRCGFMPTFKPL